MTWGLPALVAGVCGAWGYARAGAGPADLVRDLAVGWAFAVSGTVARLRRPANRTGPLLYAEGLTWFLGNLQGFSVPVLFAAGAWGEALNLAVLGHLLLVFPDGRAGSGYERRLVVAGYALVAVGGLVRALLYDPAADSSSSYLACARCGPNALFLFDAPALFEAVDVVYRWAGVVLTVLVTLTMVRRWRAGSPARRRVLLPAWVAVGLTFSFVGWEVLYLLAPEGLGGADAVVTVLSDVTQVAVPVVFLVSLLRMRLRRASVGELVLTVGRSPGHHGMQDMLRRTLGDPSLVLGLRADDGGHSGPDGRPVPPPGRGGGDRAVTPVPAGAVRDAEAVLEHDRSLAEDTELMAAVGEVVRLWVRDLRVRSEAGVRGGQGDRAVPRRILQAVYEERKKLERDLHDGAQTRMLYTLMTLRRLDARLAPDADPALRRTVAEAEEGLRQSIEELRDLARGIHPAVLARAGLGPALTSLAEQCPVPVAVETEPGRWPAVVETTAYFLVSEALANAVKHAAARRIRVAVRGGGPGLVVEVADDGVGGVRLPSADGPESLGTGSGTGLKGLADRVAAVGGTLSVVSPAGGGTRIRAELPCG
ncbi:sensor histidine kinase [Streptomyces ficellus]|uniref:sensor histidine kinase n=1 Tax=Streptomyces ficellus TaxID=1977088 RepID=UPI001FCACB68|nr:ATP-binding protein [Streptomyces ficellus]